MALSRTKSLTPDRVQKVRRENSANTRQSLVFDAKSRHIFHIVFYQLPLRVPVGRFGQWESRLCGHQSLRRDTCAAAGDSLDQVLNASCPESLTAFSHYFNHFHRHRPSEMGSGLCLLIIQIPLSRRLRLRECRQVSSSRSRKPEKRLGGTWRGDLPSKVRAYYFHRIQNRRLGSSEVRPRKIQPKSTHHILSRIGFEITAERRTISVWR